jgi:hypothetical protein
MTVNLTYETGDGTARTFSGIGMIQHGADDRHGHRLSASADPSAALGDTELLMKVRPARCQPIQLYPMILELLGDCRNPADCVVGFGLVQQLM